MKQRDFGDCSLRGVMAGRHFTSVVSKDKDFEEAGLSALKASLEH